MAPEIPTAMYSCGATILPVWPTCMSLGTKPGVDGGTGSTDRSAQLVGQRIQVLEVVAVLHATAAGNDDLGSGQLRTIGLGQLFTDKRRLASVVGSATASTAAEPPSAATASKPVARTVMTLTAALDCTVAIALPA